MTLRNQPALVKLLTIGVILDFVLGGLFAVGSFFVYKLEQRSQCWDSVLKVAVTAKASPHKTQTLLAEADRCARE